MVMFYITSALLLLSPALDAHREGMESGSHLSAVSGAAAAEAAYHASVHKKMVECQGVKHLEGETLETKESLKKMENCVTSIASFAQNMQRQRQKSLIANRNYKEDIVLAKKILKYLTKQTDSHQQKFEDFKQTEEQHLDDIHKMLRDREDRGGALVQRDAINEPLAQDFYAPGNPGSYLGLNTMQSPMLAGNLAMQPMSALQQNAEFMNQLDMATMMQAAMLTPSGQNLRPPRNFVEGGLVGRRPSLLQLGGLGSRQGGQGGGSMQAESTEEADERDLRGGDVQW